MVERVSIFNLLLAYNGVLTTDQILDSLKVSRPTALRTMAEFHTIDLASIEEYHEEGQNNISNRLVLNPRFNWILENPVIKKIFSHTILISKHSKKQEGGEERKEEVTGDEDKDREKESLLFLDRIWLIRNTE